MLEALSDLLKATWLLVSNTYILAFLITGLTMWVAREYADFWFGRAGGALLYALVALILSIFL